MTNLNGVEIPAHYNGVGLHDTPGSETAAWDYHQAANHARELRAHGVTLYKLFGSGTKGQRARAYHDNGIVVVHRWWPGGAHWGKPPAEWLMSRASYDYLRDNGVSLFEPGWNEFNIAEEWTTPIPNATGIAHAVVDAWEAAGDRYGSFDHLLFPSNTPGGNVDHRACYRAIAAQIVNRGLQDTIKHVAIHPRPLNNPPSTRWTSTNTCTFDEWQWIRDQLKAAYVNAYYWATEHGYSLGDGQNTEHPSIDLTRWTAYNWALLARMNPAHQAPISPELAGVMHWYNAGWGHWGPWKKDAIVDSPDPAMPAPSPLWTKMASMSETLAFSRYEGITPPPNRAWGVDTASFQVKEINFDALYAAGARIVLIRFTGPNADRTKMIVDPSAHQFWERAGNAGFLRGGYHGLMLEEPNQALFYAKAVGGRKLEMGWWSDLEVMALTDLKCEAHLLAMDRHSDKPLGTGVYSNLKFMKGHEGYWAKGREAWLAAWGDPDAPPNPNMNPIVPKQFTKGWTLLQYTNKGINIPGVPYRICLDVFHGTETELYDKYGSPTNGGNGEDEMVEVVDRYGKPLGITWEEVQEKFGLRMVAADPPEGATVWRLSKIIHDSTPEPNLRLYCTDENGAPLSKITVMMGMHPDVAGPLPPNMAPRFALGQQGQPIDPLNNQPYPNVAWLDQDNSENWTNADGYVQRSLGSGSNTIPPRPIYQWAWVANGEKVEYTDWVYGIGGMWAGEQVPGHKGEHQMFWAEFMRVTEGDDPGPGPENGDLKDVVAQLKRIADKLEAGWTLT